MVRIQQRLSLDPNTQHGMKEMNNEPERTPQQQLPELQGVKTRLSNKHICTEDKMKTVHPGCMTKSILNILYSRESVDLLNMSSESTFPFKKSPTWLLDIFSTHSHQQACGKAATSNLTDSPAAFIATLLTVPIMKGPKERGKKDMIVGCYSWKSCGRSPVALAVFNPQNLKWVYFFTKPFTKLNLYNKSSLFDI